MKLEQRTEYLNKIGIYDFTKNQLSHIQLKKPRLSKPNTF